MKKESMFRLRQSALLLLTALIWGVAFAMQSMAMDHVGPFTFVAIRFMLGAAALLPFILLQERRRKKAGEDAVQSGRVMSGKLLWTGGILCGLALGTASTIQQVGIQYTTAGKAGFLTAMYIVMVPILGTFIGRRAKPLIWLCVGIAAAGIYLLSMQGGDLAMGRGDLLCLLCAVVFAVQILLVDHFGALADGVRLAAIQFLTCAVLGTVLTVLFEHPSREAVMAAAVPILYAGIMSSGVAYTLQIVGQRGMNPTVASLIMSLESAISAVAGFFLLHQVMSQRELIGCLLMAVAIVLAQL